MVKRVQIRQARSTRSILRWVTNQTSTNLVLSSAGSCSNLWGDELFWRIVCPEVSRRRFVSPRVLQSRNADQQNKFNRSWKEEIIIRECRSVEEFDSCIYLQREAFGLPDLEISPRRHFIVSRQAGGWTLGAFAEDRMVGFVHHLAAIRPNNEIYGYSHVMAVARDYQNKGVGASLKWAQRSKAMSEGRDFIKWTWDPMQSRNAHFNLNRLGVTVHHYEANFYGLDYDQSGERPG